MEAAKNYFTCNWICSKAEKQNCCASSNSSKILKPFKSFNIPSSHDVTFFLVRFFSLFFIEKNLTQDYKITKRNTVEKTFTMREVCKTLNLFSKKFRWCVKRKQLMTQNSRESTIYANNILKSSSTLR